MIMFAVTPPRKKAPATGMVPKGAKPVNRRWEANMLKNVWEGNWCEKRDVKNVQYRCSLMFSGVTVKLSSSHSCPGVKYRVSVVVPGTNLPLLGSLSPPPFGEPSFNCSFCLAALWASRVHRQNTTNAAEFTTIVRRRRLCRQFLRSRIIEYNFVGFSYITSTVFRGRIGLIGGGEGTDCVFGNGLE